jgi:hypothetical protein
MALSTTYTTINSLGDIPFIAGSTYSLFFNVYDQSGSPIDLSEAVIKWKAAPYGTDYATIDKTGSVTASNTFVVYLSTEDSYLLSGKFSHQPQITFPDDVVAIPAQGIVTIIKGLFR